MSSNDSGYAQAYAYRNSPTPTTPVANNELQCCFCNRIYHMRSYYTRHILVCEMLSKGRKKRQLEAEELADTPTIRDLYVVVMEMASKYAKLEQHVESMARFNDHKKRKLDVLQWLNQNRVLNVHFDEWLSMFTQHIEFRHLEQVFENTYVPSVARCWLELLQKQAGSDQLDRLVVRAFDHQQNAFVIFRSANIWEYMSEEMFDTLAFQTHKRLLTLFVDWQNANKYRMQEDKFALIYSHHVKSVMCGNWTRVELNAKLRHELYTLLKVHIKRLSDGELSF